MKQKYGSPIVVLPRKPNKGWLKRLHVVGDAGRDVRDVIFSDELHGIHRNDPGVILNPCPNLSVIMRTSGDARSSPGK